MTREKPLPLLPLLQTLPPFTWKILPLDALRWPHRLREALSTCFTHGAPLWCWTPSMIRAQLAVVLGHLGTGTGLPLHSVDTWLGHKQTLAKGKHMVPQRSPLLMGRPA